MMIKPPRDNPVAVAHRQVKARLFFNHKAWEGPLSGKTLCTYCRERPATDAHHLIFLKSTITGAPQMLRVEFEHRFNMVEVCHQCHVASRHGLAKQRHYLIRTVQFERYGEAHVRAWALRMSERLGIPPVSMPLPECGRCQNGYGDVCAYQDACDGENHFQALVCGSSCRLPPWQFRDCQKCIEEGLHAKAD